MRAPTFHLSISGSVVAAYGAVLSTITAAVQVISHFKDRAHLQIRVAHNMEMVGHVLYMGKRLTIVYVTNVGRRPLTITSVGAYRLFPHNPFVVMDTIPRTPCELTEGKQMTALIDEAGLDLSVMESWEAYTATGKTFRLPVVPWWRRWWNRRWMRRAAVAEGKKKARLQGN